LLLGFVSLLGVASVNDAANAASVLTAVNGWTHFRLYRNKPLPWQRLRPVLIMGAFGVLVGVFLLAWLSGHNLLLLKVLLGVTILGCGLLLLDQRRQRQTMSGPASFAVTGLFAGVLGGLFASAGPPLVYQMYRQPMPLDVIRQSLLLIFAMSACLRLVFVLVAGQFTLWSAVLAACCLPVVWTITRLQYRYPLKPNPTIMRRMVAVLLGISGLSLLLPALAAL